MRVSLTGWEFDIGKGALSAKESAVEVSLPHILEVSYVGALPRVLINLFGSFKNLRKFNFGNSPLVQVNYRSGGPVGPPPATPIYDYVNLLTSLVNIPLEIGTTRISAVTQAQVKHPLYFLDNVGVGKFDGESKFPLTYPNQFQRTISYIQEPYILNGYTQLSYEQLSTNKFVTFYFYANRSIDSARAFSKEAVVQKYGVPQTSFEQTTYIQ